MTNNKPEFKYYSYAQLNQMRVTKGELFKLLSDLKVTFDYALPQEYSCNQAGMLCCSYFSFFFSASYIDSRFTKTYFSPGFISTGTCCFL